MHIFPSFYVSGKPSLIIINIIIDLLFEKTVFAVDWLGNVEVVACFLGNLGGNRRATEIFDVLVGIERNYQEIYNQELHLKK